MAKDEKTKQAQSPLGDFMNILQTGGAQSMEGAGAVWLKTMSSMGSEVMSFTTNRLHEDIKTRHDLLQAKGISEIQEIQAQFFQKAMEDYSAQTAKLLGMGKSLTPDFSGAAKSTA